MTHPTAFARHLLAKVPPGQPAVRYGSPEWEALPAQDPRRAAAVVLAAECWRDYCSLETVAAEMHWEIHEGRERLRQASHDVSAALDWAALAASPTYAELRRRRGEVA